ncbi:MAG TPA: helix-hairpin-helix domain-containing protein [Pyrinomonadaceae bacterium]|nr:helix-hairpin-helix domain-containing protein [Pyrinomonadaceae bacterium]
MSRPLLTKTCARIIMCCAVAAGAASCVKLPRRHAPAAATHAASSVPDGAHLININRATREELERLPGIGPALAARIVEHRERHGPFRRAEHLMMVRGISERRFLALRARVTAE